MTDELIMAKVNAFAQELRTMGVEDFIFAAGSSSGLLAIQYDVDPRGVSFLAMTVLMNAMFESIDNQAGEVYDGGREDYGE